MVHQVTRTSIFIVVTSPGHKIDRSAADDGYQVEEDIFIPHNNTSVVDKLSL